MLREIVATISDDALKGGFAVSSSSRSFSFCSVSSFTSLLHAPLFGLALTTDKALKMGSSAKTRSAAKPKSKNPSTSASSDIPPSTSQSHTHTLSKALHTVGRLPRKVSHLNLSCNKGHSPVEATAPPTSSHEARDGQQAMRGRKRRDTYGDGDREMERAGLVKRFEVQTGSGSTSGSAATSGYSTNSSSCALSPTTSSDTSSSVLSGSASNNTSDHPSRSQMQSHARACIPGPILSPSELAKALDRPSPISLPPSVPMPSEQGSSTADLPERNHEIFQSSLAVLMNRQDPIPRPLSPPPDHFRRRERVLSASGQGPYTVPSPVHSPPNSPRPDDQRMTYLQDENVAGTNRGGEVCLHKLLSTESFVAPRLKLYNGVVDSDSEANAHGDFKSIKSDSVIHAHSFGQANPRSGMNLLVRPGRPGPSNAIPMTRERASSFLQHTPRFASRLPVEGGTHDTNALRRVFSR